MASLEPTRVLDAGCGTGRVAIELARRGIKAVGVDADPVMLDTARRRAAHIEWWLEDLSRDTLPSSAFDLVVMAGNVMIFLAPGTEPAVVSNLSGSLRPNGVLVAGFQLGSRSWGVEDYDGWATESGLSLEARWSTWERGLWRAGGDYAVSLHRKPLPAP